MQFLVREVSHLSGFSNGWIDIAAFSSNVRIVYKGRVGGTSCASPTAAGLFALLNDVRLQNGMATLGFANPLIYQIATAHSDAFTGS